MVTVPDSLKRVDLYKTVSAKQKAINYAVPADAKMYCGPHGERKNGFFILCSTIKKISPNKEETSYTLYEYDTNADLDETFGNKGALELNIPKDCKNGSFWGNKNPYSFSCQTSSWFRHNYDISL